MTKLGALLRLARLPFLFAGFAGVALGALVARFDGAPFRAAAYLDAQLMVTAFQLMVHFSNEYFDQATDALTTRTAWSGGSGVLPAGALAPRTALTAARGCAAAGVAAVAGAAAAGRPLLALAGAATGALAWAYSAPPWRLLARGFGEIDTVAVVAVLVPCLGYAACAGTLGVHLAAAVVPGACAMFAMMLAVEQPDARADAATGKRTLVVRWGARRAAVVARTFATAAVLALLFVGAGTFHASSPAFLAVIPAAAAAGALAEPQLVARWRFARDPFLSVAFYALTTCGAIALVLGASP